MSLQRTDPSVRIDPDKEGQLLVHGLGALHLEIIEGRLLAGDRISAVRCDVSFYQALLKDISCASGQLRSLYMKIEVW